MILSPSVRRGMRTAFRILALFCTAVGISACEGCYDEDDIEPRLAIYIVSASPSRVVFNDANKSAVITLSAMGRDTNNGVDLDTGDHDPRWSFSSYSRHLAVSITDPHSPQTTATVTFIGSPDAEAFDSTRSYEASEIIFTVTPPAGYLGGAGSVSYLLEPTLTEPEIEEPDAEDPALHPSTASVTLEGPGSTTASFTYNGPPTTITLAPSGAPEFDISAPLSGPIDSGGSVEVSIDFAGTTDFDDKTAVITATTENGASAAINVVGRP